MNYIDKRYMTPLRSRYIIPLVIQNGTKIIHSVDLSPYAPIRWCPTIKSNMRLSLACEAKIEYNE